MLCENYRQRFEALNAKFDVVNARLDAIGTSFDHVGDLWRAELRRMEEVRTRA